MFKQTCIFVLLSLAAGCEFSNQTSDLDIESVPLGQLRRMIDGEGEWRKKSPTVLVDVRSATQFKEGHIPVAINIPIKELTTADPRLSGAYNIVVHAFGWTDALSGAAFKKLITLGYQNVYDFRGGLEAWKTQGLKVVGGGNRHAVTSRILAIEVASG